jgi:NAD(P)-dependent dehydrogenase (short-subunit alcohol dehydrogenase family)
MSGVEAGTELEGRVALLTGAGSLLGGAIAGKLVDAGARVVMAGRNVENLAEFADPLGDAARAVRADVTDDGDLDRIVSTAIDEFGRIDFVISGAAIFDCGMLDTTREQWLRSFDVNVIGASLLVQRVVPHIQEQGGGSVVFIGSISGHRSQPNRLVYPTTKSALLGLTRNLAQALAPDRIRVNHISLGWTWSRNIERRYGSRERADEFAAEFQALGRMADPDEVGDPVVYLCSDRSSFITGAAIAVDGGYLALGPEAMGQPFDKVPVLGTPPARP